MVKQQLLFKSVIAGFVVIMATSCKKDSDNSNDNAAQSTYMLGLGITVSSSTGSTTTNYIVQANDLTTGTISPVGNGLTLNGYRDYSIGNKTVFAVGGLGVTDINAITQDGNGTLSVSGNATFDKAQDDIQQVDGSQMLALKYPAVADGTNATFSFINIDSKVITSNATSSITPLIAGGDYPIYTGMVVRGNQLFVSYTHFDANYNTNHTDTNYIAVYSYPQLQYQSAIYDTRTGPTGAWQTKNGLFKDEKGDIYAMSSSNISNGYSKSTKPGGFLKIKSGAAAFDNTYFFNTDNLGGKVSHIRYIGNGLVFATISTIATQTVADRWGDKDLKMAIIDVYNQKITDVKLAGGTVNDLKHDGNGGRSFPVLVDNGKVYYTATIGGKTNIYVVDVASATATKGAEIAATFTGGIFKVK